MMRTLIRCTALAGAFMLLTLVHAQWQVTNLHPEGASFSIARSIHNGRQVGEIGKEGQTRAALWSGTSTSMIDLHPTGASMSRAFGIYKDQQVGFAKFNGVDHAMLWTGSPEGVDLHDGRETGTLAYAVYEGVQVGKLESASLFGSRAALWSGTSGSLVDLGSGRAVATYGGVHFGHSGRFAQTWGEQSQVFQEYSMGRGIHGNQLVGHKPAQSIAMLWRGLPDTLVFLAPGATDSFAFGVHAGVQVGGIELDEKLRACLWRSLPEAFIDLHSLLPKEFIESQAFGVWHDRLGRTHVVGYGHNSNTKRDEALIWTYSGPVSTGTLNSLEITRGVVTGGNAGSVAESDDSYLSCRPGITFSTGQAPIQMDIEFVVGSIPESFLAVVESKASSPAIRQRIEAFNYSTGLYERIDDQKMTISDRDIFVGLNPPSSYIGPSKQVTIRLTYRASGPVFAYPWSVSVDQIKVIGATE